MKTTVCKITAFLLLLTLSLLTLSGCGRQGEEEFLKGAEQLLEKSAVVNEICFGEGLAYGGDNAYMTGGYLEATEEARTKYAVNSAEDIKTRVAEVYSVAVVDYIGSVIFNPVKEDNTFVSYRRYFDAMDGEGAVALMVKKDYEPLAVGKVSYANLRVESLSRARATLLVDITVTNGEESRTDKDVSLSMRFENDAWKFDTVTYSSLK